MIQQYNKKTPKIAKTVFVAKSADIIGDVEIGEHSSVWYNTVIRADEAPIRIGRNVSVQDGSILHVYPGKGTEIGDNVTVGHNCIIHGCTIGPNCIIGMGAIILSKAEVGEGCIIGAGAVVKEGDKIPPRSLAVGIPAKVVRQTTIDDLKRIEENWKEYSALKGQYMKQKL